MRSRAITLRGGPCHGMKTVASGDVARQNKELYVWDGTGDGNVFVHAQSLVDTIPEAQREEERSRVKAWLNSPAWENAPELWAAGIKIPAPPSALIGIPPWRIQMWMELEGKR